MVAATGDVSVRARAWGAAHGPQPSTDFLCRPTASVNASQPSATKYVDETNPAKPLTIYDLGFPLGFRGSSDIPGTKEGVSYLNNHLLLTIK